MQGEDYFDSGFFFWWGEGIAHHGGKGVLAGLILHELAEWLVKITKQGPAPKARSGYSHQRPVSQWPISERSYNLSKQRH